MKQILIVFTLMISKILFADTIIKPETQTPPNQDLEDSIKLKPNQILLIDYKNQKLIGIIEIKSDGSFIRLPLPKKYSKIIPAKVSAPSNQNNQNPQKEDEKLIYKNKQWDKKQIPYLIKEEILIPKD